MQKKYWQKTKRLPVGSLEVLLSLLNVSLSFSPQRVQNLLSHWEKTTVQVLYPETENLFPYQTISRLLKKRSVKNHRISSRVSVSIIDHRVSLSNFKFLMKCYNCTISLAKDLPATSFSDHKPQPLPANLHSRNIISTSS